MLSIKHAFLREVYTEASDRQECIAQRRSEEKESSENLITSRDKLLSLDTVLPSGECLPWAILSKEFDGANTVIEMIFTLPLPKACEHAAFVSILRDTFLRYSAVVFFIHLVLAYLHQFIGARILKGVAKVEKRLRHSMEISSFLIRELKRGHERRIG